MAHPGNVGIGQPALLQSRLDIPGDVLHHLLPPGICGGQIALAKMSERVITTAQIVGRPRARLHSGDELSLPVAILPLLRLLGVVPEQGRGQTQANEDGSAQGGPPLDLSHQMHHRGHGPGDDGITSKEAL